MDPIEIKVGLLRAQVTQTDIARKLEVAVASVNDVIHKKKVSRKIQQGVADAIKKPFAVVWPEKEVV